MEQLETMSKKADNQLIVGLDIGTTKVVALVGEVTPEGRIDIVGIGTQESCGKICRIF